MCASACYLTLTRGPWSMQMEIEELTCTDEVKATSKLFAGTTAPPPPKTLVNGQRSQEGRELQLPKVQRGPKRSNSSANI
jgi:hypothetical protein